MPLHTAASGEERGERPDKRKETPEENRRGAVPLNHRLALLNPLRGHRLDLPAVDDSLPNKMTDKKVTLVAENCRIVYIGIAARLRTPVSLSGTESAEKIGHRRLSRHPIFGLPDMAINPYSVVTVALTGASL